MHAGAAERYGASLVPYPLRRLRTAAALWAALAVACARPASYPLGATVDFDIACVRNLWPGAPSAPLDVREAFCDCVLRRARTHWAAEEFDRIRAALARSGYRPDGAGVPAEFRGMMDECTRALERGTLAVE